MTPIAILDNGGATFDRYTFIFEQDGIYPYWGSSEKPSHPQGFGQYCGDWNDRSALEEYLRETDDKLITALDLPQGAYAFYKLLCRESVTEEITEQQFVDAAYVMRKRGYAIVIFSPDEIPGGQSEAALFEDSLAEAGRHTLEAMNEENEANSSYGVEYPYP